MTMRQQLWRVFGTALLIGVVILLVATNTRQFADAYYKVDPSPDWSFAAAVMVVGAMVLALMFSEYAASRWSFLGLSAALVGAVAINVAAQLKMVSAAWAWPILIITSLPFGLVAWIVWSLVVNLYSKPILAQVLVQTETNTSTETTQNQLSKPKPERKLPGVGRILLQRPPRTNTAKSKPKPTETTPDTETETAETDTQLLYYTLEMLRRQGRVAAAARELKVSPTAVNKRLQRLYDLDPQRVRDAVPDWVERNIKEVEVSA